MSLGTSKRREARMGVEITIDGLTKSFGKQLIWGDVTLTVPAGEICVMLARPGRASPCCSRPGSAS
jgi:ABC-type transporter Mla maintaining outer membrane lipid asymmetry ATPase subunit MlaF